MALGAHRTCLAQIPFLSVACIERLVYDLEPWTSLASMVPYSVEGVAAAVVIDRAVAGMVDYPRCRVARPRGRPKAIEELELAVISVL